MPTRRHFLRSAAAGTAGLAAPNLLLAQKTDPAKPVIGVEHFKYECEHNWGRLPEGHHYGGASHGIAIDSQGLIYIAHQGEPGSVFVFDKDGNFVRSMVPELKGEGHGIDIRREGDQDFIYLSPNSFSFKDASKFHECLKINMKGETVWRGGRPEESKKYRDGKRFNATNISFTPDGGWHVGDGYGSHYIHRYDRKGNYVSTFGGAGDAPGRFQTPHGHWLDERDTFPKICVCDRANKRLQWLTLDGQPLNIMEGFLFPAAIDIQGDVMCVPDLHCRITLLDRGNRVITHLGDDPAWRDRVVKDKTVTRKLSDRDKWEPGKFVHPHDACFDKAGNIFVAEWVEGGRITKLRKV